MTALFEAFEKDAGSEARGRGGKLPETMEKSAGGSVAAEIQNVPYYSKTTVRLS